MTRPQYAPVPRGYVRVWVVTVAGCLCEWMYRSERRARINAEINAGTITPLDIPAGAVPGLGTTKKARKR